MNKEVKDEMRSSQLRVTVNWAAVQLNTNRGGGPKGAQLALTEETLVGQLFQICSTYSRRGREPPQLEW